ncbi:hypothetical protein EI42_03145 [Thermosporothrix hazakensis]|uniref:Uncharacterized protein n=1 Tax=Thermosporothrix hazakensis TaxID=644383 RepID=A0A326U6Z8_THEHA|nr:hypothetical protein EI42_03145 [Thermosporothrix hazakensis]
MCGGCIVKPLTVACVKCGGVAYRGRAVQWAREHGVTPYCQRCFQRHAAREFMDPYEFDLLCLKAWG